MTRMMATGVNQAKMLVCKEVAPVINGEVCASAKSGVRYRQAMSTTNNAERG
jgi:hypothetical protein